MSVKLQFCPELSFFFHSIDSEWVKNLEKTGTVELQSPVFIPVRMCWALEETSGSFNENNFWGSGTHTKIMNCNV